MIPSSYQRVGLFDAQGVIVADQPCRRCGYNLRGLREDGRCPECGTPVGLSTTGDLLRFADPNWVEKVARGLSIILWMILVALVLGLLGGVLSSVVHPVVGQLVTLIAPLISLYGVWLMTEPDPSGIGEDPNLTARKVIRVTLLVGFASQLLQFLIQSLPLPSMVIPVVAISAVAAGIVGLIGEYAKFLYYEKLARRIPDEAMARRARMLRWGYTIALGLTVVIGGIVGALALAAPQSAMASVFAPLACMAIPALIALVVFAVMTLFLLLRLRKAIAEQAALARQSWAAATLPPPAAPPVVPR